MFWEINGTHATSLCLCEGKETVYVASSFVKEILFSDYSKSNRISSARYALLQLSVDERFLALINPEYRFELYNTEDMSKPLFAKRWRNATASRNLICFFQNRSVLIPVQNVVYALNLQAPYQLEIIYGDSKLPPTQAEWNKKGYIISISTFNDEVVILHKVLYPFKTLVIRMKGKDYSIISVQELPPEIQSKYDQLIFDQKGGMCLFSSIIGAPMLYYKIFPTDFLQSDATIQFPPLSHPTFSRDGRYLTFKADVEENIYPEGWLIDTSKWNVINIVKDRIVINPSFSHDNKYWLIPGKKPLVIKLPEMI